MVTRRYATQLQQTTAFEIGKRRMDGREVRIAHDHFVAGLNRPISSYSGVPFWTQ